MTPDALRHRAEAWLAAAVPVVEVCVTAHQGSAPRETGTRMLVTRDAVTGTVGGGHLEWVAIETARGLLQAQRDDAVEQRYALGPSLGQCCGGAVTLRCQHLTPARLATWTLPPPRFWLQLYGAGHVGRAVAELLRHQHCRVQWIDEREEHFPAAPLAPHIETVCVEPVEAEVASAPPGAVYLVMTHEHALDERITHAILQRGDFGFCGLIGSASKRQKFLHRFERRGIAPPTLARLTCPIGLPGITGKEPEVIAVAVVAQLLAVSSP
jgi:xanthine dehydrogenase accessory factor